ncbi:hypothetical protein KEM55_003613 [Ascosphaera atra]|nr:hypothetical protein KEM55_003613 [Ascosphaera atra]
MTVYHIVLFKLKQGVPADDVEHLQSMIGEMAGKIPGLKSIHSNPPVSATAVRAKGYDLGLVAVLEDPTYLPLYSDHPVHQEVLDYIKPRVDDVLAYDMEF